MRKRNISILIRLDNAEKQQLNRNVRQSGLTQESYIRSLIVGKVPKAAPPVDYYTLMRELHAIGNNINQIAAKANATGDIHAQTYMQYASQLRQALIHIQHTVELPE